MDGDASHFVCVPPIMRAFAELDEGHQSSSSAIVRKAESLANSRLATDPTAPLMSSAYADISTLDWQSSGYRVEPEQATLLFVLYDLG